MKRYEKKDKIIKVFQDSPLTHRVDVWDYHKRDGWIQQPHKFFLTGWIAEEYVSKLLD